MGRIMKLVCFALVATAILASQRALALNIRDGKGNYAYKSYDSRDKLDGQTGGHWFNCGPTGIRASIDNRRLTELLVQYVYPGSPADKKIVKGDRIIGANGKVWKVPDGMPQSDQAKNLKQGYHGPRMEIGKAVEESEGGSGARKGILALMIIRGDKTINVDVPIRPIGAFSPTFPYNCEKTKLIVKEACEFLVKNGLRGCPNKRGHNHTNAIIYLALLSQGETYMQYIREYVDGGNYGPTDGWTWCVALNGILNAELYLATKDKRLLPHMKKSEEWASKAQFPDGSYSHHQYTVGQTGFEYGVMAYPTAAMCTMWALFKRCDIKIHDFEYDKSRRIVDLSTNPYGEIGYGLNGKHNIRIDGKRSRLNWTGIPDPVPIKKGSARAGGPIRMWGASGIATMFHFLDPYETYSEYYVQRGVDAVGHSRETFMDGHGSCTLHAFSGFLTAALAPAVGKGEVYREVLDYYKWWLNANRCHDGSFYKGPNRDVNSSGTVDSRFGITGSTVILLSAPGRNLEMLGRNPFVPGIDPKQLKGNARSAYIAMSKGNFADVMKKVTTLKAGEAQDQRVAELLGKYISERMQQALGDLAGFEQEQKLLQLTTCLEASNKMFVGIPAYDEKTAMLTSLLLKGKGGIALGFIERDKYASALKTIAAMKQESEDEQRVFRLMDNYVLGRMQQALDDLAGFEKEQKLLELTTCLEESNKMFTGIPAYDEKTAMLTSLLLKGRGKIALGFVARDKYGSAMKAAAPMKDKGEDAQRVFRLLENHAIKYATVRITEIEAQHKVGDLYKVSLLIAVADKTCKGVAKYDQAVAPIKLIMKSLESRRLISRGREYYRILGIYNRTKSKADRKRITVFAKRYADTFYGKLAAALP